ncbi:MAG: hypothetical protein IKH18_08725 [Clostridia bacterium]|nr:hypothetical protein [Clostridia bacterium]
MPKEDNDLKYEIINEIAVISDDGKWRLELNRISWNGRDPKYDLRKWSPNHEKMSKGITLSDDEIIKLADAFTKEKEFLIQEN